MRKSNFLKSLFLSQGQVPCTSKRKRLVTFNILAFLFVIGSSLIPCDCIIANAQENVMEVTPSSPDSVLLAEITSLNYRIDDIESLIEDDVAELQDINTNTQILTGVTSHIFGGIFLIIAIIVFIAVYKLLNIFFRF